MSNRSFIVLYAEDEESDRFFMQKAFAREGHQTALRVVNNGKAAMDYLSGKGAYAQRDQYPLPVLMLLDLNLPEIHGFEVLQWVRAHPVHGNLPVVIFSSSSRKEDRDRARELGATEFIAKPGSVTGYWNLAKKLLTIFGER
jgi:CheY-like chemotaxis protein